VPERETVCALEANTPHRLTKQFFALPPTELGQEILKIGRRRLFVAFLPKQLRDVVVVDRIHFSASYRLIRQS
jgi:hypothetical protein